MVPDSCGFLYPQIDQETCVSCHACTNLCAFTKPNQASKFMHSYIAKHKCVDVVKQSQSGGMFTAISDVILEKNGVIYGAVLDNDFFVKHIRGTDSIQRDAIRKSKYVQSNLNNIFFDVENDLQARKIVLFTGTPCQCEGLKNYISSRKIDDSNLIICDILCHASASPGVFKEYLHYQSKKHKSKIVQYIFRDTEHHNWGEYAEKIVFENGKQIYTDEYLNLFFGDNIRPACYQCKYTSLHRVSDITIGDCWGGHVLYPELANKTGASLVLVNTEKGACWFEKASSKIVSHEINIDDVLQPRLREPETKSLSYEKFWSDYVELGFSEILLKYSENNYYWTKIFHRKVRKFAFIPIRAIRKMIRMLIR